MEFIITENRGRVLICNKNEVICPVCRNEKVKYFSEYHKKAYCNDCMGKMYFTQLESLCYLIDEIEILKGDINEKTKNINR